jgi:predicted RNase H-like nuclease (RuvC/YqgF family)
MALSVHEENVRTLMKSVRSREETLDELRRRRRTLGSQAESADKKLSKLGSEHKNLVTQTQQLNLLREEIRMLDSEIMTEEARIGDFKREATKEWMSLRFVGLSELSTKGSVELTFGLDLHHLSKHIAGRWLWQDSHTGEEIAE